MFQKIAKHRANDASNDVHRPPLSGVGTEDDNVDGVDGLNADDQVGNLVILNLFLALLLSSFSDMGGGKCDVKVIKSKYFCKTNAKNLEYSCKCFCLKYLFNLVRLLGVD